MDALVNNHGMVSIGGRNLTNLRYANDINKFAGNEEELTHLVQCLDVISGVYKMEIMVNDHALQTVKEFEYFGSIVSNEGFKPTVLARTAQALSTIARLKPIWADKGLNLMMKIKFMHSIIFLYACETWTLNTDLECRIWAMDM